MKKDKNKEKGRKVYGKENKKILVNKGKILKWYCTGGGYYFFSRYSAKQKGGIFSQGGPKQDQVGWPGPQPPQVHLWPLYCGLPRPPGQLTGHPPSGRQGGGPTRTPPAKHRQGASAVPGAPQLLQKIHS